MNLAVGICVLLLIIQIQARKPCLTQDECAMDTECCMTLRPRDYRTGYCSSRLKKGRKCHPSNEIKVPSYDLYFLRCPCDAGLECIPSSVTEVNGAPEFKDATCIKPEI